jgi:hypothetical protein
MDRPLGEGAPAQFSSLEFIYRRTINSILGFVGLTIFILIIMAGFTFITSGGDPGKVANAKKELTYALYGFGLIAISLLILQTIALVTGVDKITTFTLVLP